MDSLTRPDEIDGLEDRLLALREKDGGHSHRLLANQAIKEIFNHYAPKLLRNARSALRETLSQRKASKATIALCLNRLANDPSLVNDAIADTLLSVWKDPNYNREKGASFSTYLTARLGRVLSSKLRSRKVDQNTIYIDNINVHADGKKGDQTANRDTGLSAAEDELLSKALQTRDVDSPEGQTIQLEKIDVLNDCAHLQLRQKGKQIKFEILKRRLLGEPLNEIAADLGIPEGTVKSHLSQATKIVGDCARRRLGQRVETKP